MKNALIFLFVFILFACNKKVVTKSDKLFTRVLSSESNLTFVNRIIEDSVINQFAFAYAYNGAGISAGDLNNDGLEDLIFTANMGKSKVYLNKGDLKFEEITDKTGFNPTNWSTGVSMVDVNNDGFLDVYVSRSGTHLEADQRGNLLYINQGDLTFKEESVKWGIDDKGFTTQTIFFDMDNDGDLDAYVLNAGRKFYENIDLPNPPTRMEDEYNVHRLYENKGDKFEDISKKAGVHHYGYGLGAIPMDFNKDGKMDLYVCNDYFMPDKIFINQGGNVFKNELDKYMKHTSLSSMGLDAADINNDGNVDVFVCEMMPQDHIRKHKLGGATPFDRYRLAVKNGYGHQNMRNVLQMNNGDNTFSDIGYSADVAETDWSWTSLLADFDQDGYRDLYVCNGYFKEVTDQDFTAYSSFELGKKGEKPDLVKVLSKAPSIKTPNYIFKNNGDLTFSKKSSEWGVGDLSFSNGAIYSDLDNDGDLEIIVTNINDEIFLYENNSNNKNFLKIKFDGKGGSNTFGQGCKVSVVTDKNELYGEHTTFRGYQGTVSPIMHFGLANASTIKAVYVEWPDGKGEKIVGVVGGTEIVAKYTNAKSDYESYTFPVKKFNVQFKPKTGLNHTHKEFIVSDFKREPLLQTKYSQLGPALAVGDVNGDNLQDVVVSGSYKGSKTTLYLQNSNGSFSRSSSQPWANIETDVTGLLLFDADGDKDLDLYIGPGGNEISTNRKAYTHKLYKNNGRGLFSEDKNALEGIINSCATVSAADYDADGDLDLFVAGRLTPNQYPTPCRSYLLRNDGGKFVDVTESVIPELYETSMITSAVWADYNNDKKPDLILVGEWTPLIVMENTGAKFLDKTLELGLLENFGWFNSVTASDFDGDGDLDFLLGNRGLATQWKADKSSPIKLFVNDFDMDGRIDPIFTKRYSNGKDLLIHNATDVSYQMERFFRKNFKRNEQFLGKSVIDIFGTALVDESDVYTVNNFRTIIYENKQNEKWVSHDLPNDVQVAPINGALPADFDGDGKTDIMLVGNNYGVKTEYGREDAFNGGILKNKGGFNFEFFGRNQTGFTADNDARSIVVINIKGKPHFIVGNSNSPLQLFSAEGLDKKSFVGSLNSVLNSGGGYLSQSGIF